MGATRDHAVPRWTPTEALRLLAAAKPSRPSTGCDPGPALKELEQQVLDQSLELQSPGRASLRSAPVPVPLTSLVGRDDDVARLVDAIVAQRLTVLIGPGGVGKTPRRASRSAAAYVERGRTVYFVDLSIEQDASGVLPAFATAANLSDDASATTIAAAAEHAEALIVVDDFEHVLTPAMYWSPSRDPRRTHARLSRVARGWVLLVRSSFPSSRSRPKSKAPQR